MADGTVSTTASDVPAPASWDFKGDGIDTYTLEEVDNHLETSLGYSVADDTLKTALQDKVKDITDTDLERLDGHISSTGGRDGKLTEAELEFDNDSSGIRDASVFVGGTDAVNADAEKTYTVSSYADKLEKALDTGESIDERGLLYVLNKRREPDDQLTFTSAFTEAEAESDITDAGFDPSDIDEIRSQAEIEAEGDTTKRVKYGTSTKDFTVASLAKSAETALTQAGYKGQDANIDESGLASIFAKKSLDDKVLDIRIDKKFDIDDDGSLDIFEIQEMQKQAKERGTESKLIDKDAQWDYDVKPGVDTYNAAQFAKAVRSATGLDVNTGSTKYKQMIEDGKITDMDLRTLDTTRDGYLSQTELASITNPKTGIVYSGDDKTSYTATDFLNKIKKQIGGSITNAQLNTALNPYFGGKSNSFTNIAGGELTDSEILAAKKGTTFLDKDQNGVLSLSELQSVVKGIAVPQNSGGTAAMQNRSNWLGALRNKPHGGFSGN